MTYKTNLRVLALLAGFISSLALVQAADTPRERMRIDDNWRFSPGDNTQSADASFDDSQWRKVTLPHDWSIEGKIDAKAPMGGGGGFFPAGVAWYRLQFDAPQSWQGKRVEVEFEGVYMAPEIYLNGKKLYSQPYGYTSFFVDLTDTLKAGEKNVLAVRVDNSKQKNSRWYSGSGIYRHVWLQVSDPVHVANWGVFVSTVKASPQSATLSVQTKALNQTAQPLTVKLQTDILSPDGNKIGSTESDCPLSANGEGSVEQSISLSNPPLWSPETPQLCQAVTRVIANGKVLDTVTTPFGVRQLAWAAKDGLTINGKTYKMKGGCIHADNGVLGVSAFDRAEERKVELLKAAGFNALRTAHHPPSPALLDVCDRLGILVMDESFDCWTKGKNNADYSVYFKDWWQRDQDSMVLRDRNHPSIVMWSIGNEVPEVYSNAEVAAYGPKLVAAIHALDKTRPVTNSIFSWPSSFPQPKPEDEQKMKNAELSWDCQDIVGSNYEIGKHVAQHDQHPDRVLVSTESSPPLGPYQHVLNNSFVVGDFVWSAQDYLGEVGVGRWFYEGDPTEPLDNKGNPVGHGRDDLYPWHGANSGHLDILGNTKPASLYWNVVWQTGLVKLGVGVRQPQTDDKKIKVAGWGWYPTWSSWTWPGWEGKNIEVEVYSSYEKTRLYLNGKKIDEQPTKNYRTIYKLPYEPGTLKVAGLQNDKEVEETTLTTTGAPSKLRLTPDRSIISADEQDLSFIKVEVLDQDGKVQPNADQLVKFTLSGPGSIAGLGNANLKGDEPYQGTECHVFHGKALIVLRGSKQPGTLHLKASAEGLAPAETSVATK
ncbi:MAG: DUF4982 domain-containing protein [Verrucomicrobiales bacterium]|jgi:beta-galactosidase|nr:DUF4982 domain-containing protein [Verrucomicrobiales bacterium]